jgi:glutathione S-transferase
MTQIRIHSLVAYDRGGKARWLLTEMGMPYETRWINREKKENESPEYLRLNPMGRAPVAEIDDQAIFESSAICAYLADRFMEKGMAPVLSSPERAKYQQWMYFAAATIDPIMARMMIIEDMPAGELRTQKESAMMEDFHDAMIALDNTLSKELFLVGNRFSTADICVGYHLYFCSLWSEFSEVIGKFPSVASYLQRLKEMPSAIQAKVFSYEG